MPGPLARLRTQSRPDEEIKKGGVPVCYENRDGIEKIHVLTDDLHTCTIGATRSGKTRCLVLQSIVVQALAGESIICSDPKSELYQYTYPLLERLNYEVITLDFKNPKKSSRYNFLQPVIDAVQEKDNAKAVDLAWDMTESLVGESEGEKIWNNGEKAIIAGAIMAVVFDNADKPEFQNMTNVYYFVLEMCRTVDGKMPITKYIAGLADTHPAKGLFGVAEVAPSRTRGSFFTSALTTLRLFTNENIYSQTSESDFRLESTGDKKQAIFIILPDEKTTFYSLASLFIYQHYVALAQNADRRGGRLQIRVNYNLDEFGNFTKIPNMATFLTVGGGRGIRFNLYLQSFSMLDEKYGRESARTIKENCHAWIYLKTSDGETSKAISDRLGTYTCSSFSRSSSYSSGSTKNFNSSASMSLISRPLLTPGDIQLIDRPYMLVMLAGEHPAMTHMPDISQWTFNRMLGLGDPEHNRIVRVKREARRPARPNKPIKLWNIWKAYSASEEIVEQYLADIEKQKENERIDRL